MMKLHKTITWLLIGLMLFTGLGTALAAGADEVMDMPEYGVTMTVSPERAQAMDSMQYLLTTVELDVDEAASKVSYIRFVAYYLDAELVAGFDYSLEYCDENGAIVYEIVMMQIDQLETHQVPEGATVKELFRTDAYIAQAYLYEVDATNADTVLKLMLSDAADMGQWIEFAEPAAFDLSAPSGDEGFDNFKIDGTSLKGEALSENLYGQSTLTMVNIWGTFCTPCVDEMPYLGAIAKDYDPARFQIIGVLSDVSSPTDSTAELAQAIIDMTGADYLHVIPSQAMLQVDMEPVMYVPTTLFMNAKGELIDVTVGSMSEEAWRSQIEACLAAVEAAQ